MRAILCVVVILTFALAVLAFQRTEDEYEKLFHQFLADYQKPYQATPYIYQQRLAIFKKNQMLIDEHNAKKDTYFLRMNQFGDMTDEEYSEFVLMKKGRPIGPSKARQLKVPHTFNAPAEFDWRQHNAVSPVKNQGSCGSCWAFSTVAAIEGAYAIATKNLTTFSEQQLVDCNTVNEGCNGGWPHEALEYIIDNNGINTDKCYPYTGRDGKCKYNPSCVGTVVSSYYNVTSGNETSLLYAVLQAPVSVAVFASSSKFRFYGGGVLQVPNCPKRVDELDHAVTAVGYGVLNNTKYWLIKNSWGKSWGEGGYIKMARDADNMCGVATYAQVAVVKA
jgi:C1A family cysteine protease